MTKFFFLITILGTEKKINSIKKNNQRTKLDMKNKK